MSKQWTYQQMTELTRAFQPTCVLLAAAELDVFSKLTEAPRTAEGLCSSLESDPRATRVLLDALVALELVDKNGDHYSITSQVADLLTDEGSHSVLAMAQHQANCLRRWAQLAQVVKTGKPAPRTPSIRGEAGDTASFIGAMQEVSASVADQMIQPLARLSFDHLLDIGGASGTWTLAFLRARPNLTATLFDLPEVIPMARERFSREGFLDRVQLVAGNFYSDALPAGADAAWISAIAHQNSREQNRTLFKKTSQVLRPQGWVMIRDMVMNASRTSPSSGALFAVNMLVGTESGGTFTFDEFREDLEEAGFKNVSLVRQDERMNSLVVAQK
jgi:precorrin-6B methylase 2